MSLASTPQSYGPPAEPASSGQAGSSTAALPAENSANPPGSCKATSQPAAVISKLTEVATAAGAVGPTASHLKDLLRQQGSVCYSACRYASMVTQLVNTYVRTYVHMHALASRCQVDTALVNWGPWRHEPRFLEVSAMMALFLLSPSEQCSVQMCRAKVASHFLFKSVSPTYMCTYILTHILLCNSQVTAQGNDSRT
jgi:hypothetical protein